MSNMAKKDKKTPETGVGTPETSQLNTIDTAVTPLKAIDMSLLRTLSMSQVVVGPSGHTSVYTFAPKPPLRAKVVIHPATEGGFWAEVPALPGCVTEGDTYEELLANLREAIGGYLLVFPGDFQQEEEGWTEEIDL
jgi:predicted RNase H-like HicB family nuclease